MRNRRTLLALSGVHATLAVSGIVLATACTAASLDDLGPLGGYGSNNPGVDAAASPGFDGATGSADAIAAVDGAAPPTDGGLPPPSPAAKALFTALLPELDVSCGGACHSKGTGGAPAWMAPPDAYASARAYKGIVVKDFGTSIVLNKPRHEGPYLDEPLRSKVQAWLAEEAKSLNAITLPSTDPFTVTTGANTVDISKGGTGIAGAKMTFTASVIGQVLELSNIQVTAPATSGVHIVYPIFVIVPAQGAEVEDTSFSNADQTVGAGLSATLNPGRLLLTGWVATDKMRIEFTKLEAARVADGGTTGGCKSVATFTTNAVPAIQQNTCLNCHNTGGSGNGALDLSGLAATPRNDTQACAQALSRVNTTTPAQSDIILAPTGGVAAHPYKNAAGTYSQMMQQWIVNEK